ncbi:Ribonuclease inhibitor [Anabarilius grahami]|uniref:Ribonuclease inhibitor n=1 Tax=Anabarilius grahami TaxID=495550 RepID=A0A3N0XJ41_ANAGA|nr:Ribonuclease inhibitor [Anabarilius grahami]
MLKVVLEGCQTGGKAKYNVTAAEGLVLTSFRVTDGAKMVEEAQHITESQTSNRWKSTKKMGLLIISEIPASSMPPKPVTASDRLCGFRQDGRSLERLIDCGVTDEGCAALASALRSNPSHLRVLNLSGNKLGDSGVKLFSAVLENPHCELEFLGLSDCGVTDEGCAALASALRSNPSHLRKLNMSENKLGDSGVKLLSDLKNDPHYKLEILW